MRPFAFASAPEKCRGGTGRCRPSDRIDRALDLQTFTNNQTWSPCKTLSHTSSRSSFLTTTQLTVPTTIDSPADDPSPSTHPKPMRLPAGRATLHRRHLPRTPTPQHLRSTWHVQIRSQHHHSRRKSSGCTRTGAGIAPAAFPRGHGQKGRHANRVIINCFSFLKQQNGQNWTQVFRSGRWE